MKISIIGAGNVAWHLVRVLENAGHIISDVFSRNAIKATQLANLCYNALPKEDLDFSASESELFLVCVADDAIEEIVDALILPPNTILAHTSGSKPIDALKLYNEINPDEKVQIGVFYPLQTLSKGIEVDFETVPLCIEAKNETTEKKLIALAHQLSEIVYVVDSRERKILHLASMFANNFTNHLLAIAQEIVEQNNLEFALLKPIIKETFRKALASEDIYATQTGPARRHDHKILKQHLRMLEDNDLQKQIYQTISQSIADKYEH
ncbi:MAG: DUF2520 domain-containing protein [Pseudarcicella sp.]|nr:DUF2520 domain-containing protein [Pseudarcicella sp.]MBP6411482.1 DUF2520 domain-containing protein [Pseudarcicella sp.]